MNKITRKLITYFSLLLLFMAVAVFFCFSGLFRFYTFKQREQDLKVRVVAIQEKMGEFMGGGTLKGQGRGAYFRFLNDIAMADAYVLDVNGNPIMYGKNAEYVSAPTDDIINFARQVMQAGEYRKYRRKTEDGWPVFYAGMPVFQDGQAIAAVVIRDAAEIDRQVFFMGITVLGVCMLLVLLLSVVLSVFFSRRFVLPIQQIAATTRELARGNYQVKTRVQDRTELGELAEETDLLAQKLEAARREGERLEQMQKDYISNISHELRTPVTVIRSSLEAICDGVVSGGKAEEYQRQMLEESISLQRLVNDMLELSRLQNIDFPIEQAPVDIMLVLEDAVRAVRVLAVKKGMQILFGRNGQEIVILGDYGRLRQMFVAALDNAIKYSAADSQIVVTVLQKEEGFEITIRDCGCGIPADKLGHIFEKFYRADQSGSKGSGLGLSIIKSIAQRHNMEVGIESVWQEGTTLIFSYSGEMS